MIEKNTTIKEIARIAKVSTAAVSMTLNGRPGISKDKRQEILKIVHQYRYQPNLVAKALVSNRSYTLGLIINNISDQFFTEMAKGVEETANRFGYNIILGNTNGNLDSQRKYLDLMQSRRVDGIIISTAVANDPHIGLLVKKRVPFVCLNRVPLNRYLTNKVDYVTLDNYSAGYKGIEHLWKLGHDRIAMITGALNASNALATLDGAKAALSDYGIKVEASLLKAGNYSRHTALDQAKRLLNSRKPPTAIFAHDDNMALGVREAVLSLGLKVPEDVALVGIDDIEMGALTGIELTTISQKICEMGSIGVKILVNRIEENTQRTVENIILKAELIIRKTCGFYLSNYKR
jgi:LacI family transcriptional regulator